MRFPENCPASAAPRPHRLVPLAVLLLTLAAATGHAQGTKGEPSPSLARLPGPGLLLPLPPPELRFVRPFPGEALTSDRQLTIRARFGDLDLRSLAPIEARITAEGEGGNWVVAEGDARLEDDEIGAVWDLRPVPPGRYMLTVEATAGGFTDRVSTPVKVRRPPVAALHLIDLRVLDEGVEATFAAEAAAEDGAYIDRFAWIRDHGLGFEVTSEKRFTTTYPRLGTRYYPAVEVFDDRGGTAFAGCTLDLPGDAEELRGALAYCAAERGGCLDFLSELCTPDDPETCGCEEMVVFDRKNAFTNTYCRPAPAPGSLYNDGCQVLPNPLAFGCPAGQQAFRCPVNRWPPDPFLRPSLTYGFEILAFLEPGSNPAACEEGQYAKGTVSIDNAGLPAIPTKDLPDSGRRALPRRDGTSFVFEVVDNGDPYPTFFVDTNYGADDYGQPEPSKKRYVDRRIQWQDQPGIRNLDLRERARDFVEFIAFVRGSTGNTCWCRFTIKNFYEPRDPTVTGDGLELVEGFHCKRTQ